MTRTPSRTSSRDLHTLFQIGSLGGLTDGQLLGRFAARRDEGGDPAFAALVERHGPMVLRVCRGVLRDDHEAMDAFQATFLVLARKGGSLWVRDSLGPWLHRVAYRAATRARAGAARRRALELRAAKAVEVQGDDDRDGRAAILHEELDRLPDRYRVPLVLCDLEGRTCEEAAHHLGRSVRTVKTWRARGRERLKHRLAHRGLSGFISIPSPYLTSPLSVLPRATIDVITRLATAHGMAGAVPATVLSLTEGVLRSMLATKLKVVAAAAIVVGAFAGPVGVFAYQTPTSESARSERGTREAIGSAARAQQADVDRRQDGPKGNGGEFESTAQPSVQVVTRGSKDGNKAWAIEVENGAQVRFDRPSAPMTIQGVPGGRARIEWDDDLAIESRTFVMHLLDGSQEDDAHRTTIKGGLDGFVSIITRSDGGDQRTFRAKKVVFQFEHMRLRVIP